MGNPAVAGMGNPAVAGMGIPAVAGMGIPDHCSAVEFRQMPGRGYNIAKAETLSPLDPGLLPNNVFKTAGDHEYPQWIYKSTKLNEEGCPQWAWKFPDSPDWTFQLADSLSGIRVSKVLNSASSYVEESSTSLSESADSGSLIGSGFNAAFTASQDFDNTISSMSSSQTVQTHVGQKATAYAVGVNDEFAEVNDRYWFRLALGYYTENLHDFLMTYGTHFVTELIAGAKLSQVSTFSKTSYQTASSSYREFKEELSVGYLDASGQLTHDGSKEDRQKSLTEQQRMTATMMCRGGDGNCIIDDENTVEKFWNNAYKYPATLEVKLYPHDVFVLGQRTDDGRYLNNIRWNQFQEYIHDNWQDLGAPNSFDVDRARFLELWKEALSIYCDDYTDTDGRVGNKCDLLDVELPEPAHLLLITDASSQTQTCAKGREFENGQTYSTYAPKQDDWTPLGDSVCTAEGYTGCTTVLNANDDECSEHHCSEPANIIKAVDGKGKLGSVLVACTGKTQNLIEEFADGVGAYGGSCTCPDGSVWQVGDNYDSCGSLACIGGVSGTCHRQNGVWSWRKVTCAPPTHSEEVCDSDHCLQISNGWRPTSRCANSALFCESWSKDMHRCCPVTCETGSPSESECNALNGSGSCVYPNTAQSCSTVSSGSHDESECTPHTELACREAAIASGLSLGNGGSYEFVGSWNHKPNGCYVYKSGTHTGEAYFNTVGFGDGTEILPFTSGTDAQKLSTHNLLRVPNFNCCQNDNAKDCFQDGVAQGFQDGGSGSWGNTPKGCYVYWDGDYEGKVYYNTGGQGSALEGIPHASGSQHRIAQWTC